jgi:2-dehydro-3-deoxygluconokinase
VRAPAAAPAPEREPPDATFDLFTVGEPLICLTADGRLPASPSLRKSIGGAEANVAIGLARLGLRAGYAACVGDDPFGDEIVRTLRGEGVDVASVRRSHRRATGLMIKERRSPQDVRVHYYRHGSAASELDAIGVLPRARHVHATGITLALGAGPASAVHALLAHARATGAGISFDANIRLKLWSAQEAVAAIGAVLPYVDDLLLSEAEALAISGVAQRGEAPAISGAAHPGEALAISGAAQRGDALAISGAAELDAALERLGETGVARIVVRRGARGAVGIANGERCEVPAIAAGPVVDSVGAGDAFTAGYLFERLSGAGFEAAMTTGSWAAGHVVAHAGDYEGLPDRAEYDAWRRAERVADR